MDQTVSRQQLRIRLSVLASLFAALTAAGAFIRIPIPYVPLTLQTLFVILAGSLLGPGYGAASQLIYLTVGLAGVPVFANGGGPGYIFQPTFGYLLAYPLAAFVIGYLVWGKDRFSKRAPPPLSRILFSNVVGVAVIYAVGVFVLYFNLNYIIGKETSWGSAVWIGFVVFIPSSLIKIVAGSFLAIRLGRVFSLNI